MEFGMNGLRKITAEERKYYVRKGYWENLALIDLFDRSIYDFPNEVALVCPDEGIFLTYRQLDKKVTHTALALLEAGIEKGNKVLLHVPNWGESIILFWALQRIGATPITCIPKQGRAEIENFCAIAQPTTWLVPLNYNKIDYTPLIKDIKKGYPDLKVIIVGGGNDLGGENIDELRERAKSSDYPHEYFEQFRPDPEDIVYCMPTGGTTGLSKLVTHNHNTFISNLRGTARTICWGNEDSILLATPIMHNMALACHIITLIVGGKVIMIQGTGAKDILENIERQKVTSTMITPTQLTDIINAPDLEKYDVSSMKSISTAAAHCPPDVARRVHEHFKCRIVNLFGISEGGFCLTRFSDPPEIFFNTQGLPACGITQRRVVNEEGKVLPSGQEGELQLSGPDTFMGYFGAEVENRERVFEVDGFYRTGDLARFDSRGNLIITGRKKDVIIRGGENIPVAEVEDVLITHPSVKNVAVVAMPDRRLGERACAFIELVIGVPEITLDEVIKFMEGKGCPRQNIPERVEIIDRIPLTGLKKPDKKELRLLIKKKLEQ